MSDHDLVPASIPGPQHFSKRSPPGARPTGVINIGPVPPHRIGDVYRSADAFILPTLLETFALPMTKPCILNFPS